MPEEIRSVVETIFDVNIVNVGSREVKYNPCLMIVAVNWSKSVKFAN